MTWHHPCPQKASPLARHSVKRRDYSGTASSSGSWPVLWIPSCRMACGCDRNTGWGLTHLHTPKGEAQPHRRRLCALHCRLFPAWIFHSLSLLFPLEWLMSTIGLWWWFWSQREGERLKGGEKEGYYMRRRDQKHPTLTWALLFPGTLWTELHRISLEQVCTQRYIQGEHP